MEKENGVYSLLQGVKKLHETQMLQEIKSSWDNVNKLNLKQIERFEWYIKKEIEWGNLEESDPALKHFKQQILEQKLECLVEAFNEKVTYFIERNKPLCKSRQKKQLSMQAQSVYDALQENKDLKIVSEGIGDRESLQSAFYEILKNIPEKKLAANSDIKIDSGLSIGEFLDKLAKNWFPEDMSKKELIPHRVCIQNKTIRNPRHY